MVGLLEFLLEEDGAVVPVEGEGAAGGWGYEVGGEVGVVNEGYGQEHVKEIGVLYMLVLIMGMGRLFSEKRLRK